ncbi:hypothetical protein D1872_302450 [compost metagenome]
MTPFPPFGIPLFHQILQKVCEKVVVSIPSAVGVQRNQKQIVGLQPFENALSVAAAGNGVAGGGVHLRQHRRLRGEFLLIGGEPVKHFLEQKIADMQVGAIQI